MHRPMSHLAHCVPLVWPREEHRWQRSQVDDFACQCLLWRLLLSLAAAFVVVVVLLLLLLLLKLVFNIASLHT
jgi:hypothetical protein